MHTHTTNGLAVACTEGGLAQNNFYSAQLHDMVAYHDFEGITIHADEAPRLLASLGTKPLMILRKPRPAGRGATLPLTFVRLWTLQRACDVQVAQAALGRAIAIPEAVASKTTHDSFQFDQQFGAGQDVFDALTRLLEKRHGDDYKIMKKVCIYGAGAIGGWIGAKLAQVGCDLCVVARGATLQALQAHGLRLQEGGETLRGRCAPAPRPADLGVQDLVVVAVKAPAMAEVAQAIAPLLGPDTIVLTAMNGVPWWFFQASAAATRAPG
jgi:hypothetical protein